MQPDEAMAAMGNEPPSRDILSSLIGSDVVGGAAEESSWSPMYRVSVIHGTRVFS